MKIFLLFFGILLINGCTSVNRYLKKSYDVIYDCHVLIHELVYIINTLNLKNHILVDLRPLEEYEKAHIKGAVSLNLGNISDLTNIEGFNTKKIIFYADKSVSAKKTMRAVRTVATNTNINILKNGFRYWDGPMEGTDTNSILEEHVENREKHDI